MKKVKILILGLLVATAGLNLSSCSKYEEGPAISLLPKDERVANTWVITEAYEDGEDVSDQFDQYELYLTKDGDAQLDAEYTVFGETFEDQYDGTWVFTDDKETIEFDYEGDSQDGSYQILKLTDDQFWLREIGQDLELRLSEK